MPCDVNSSYKHIKDNLTIVFYGGFRKFMKVGEIYLETNANLVHIHVQTFSFIVQSSILIVYYVFKFDICRLLV
jgi:hypothetical protein